jgi:hypothetical protein
MRLGGQSWVEFDITDYTSRFAAGSTPEEGVRHWLLQETGPVWNKVELDCLSVSAERVKVYHTPEVQQKVAATLGRFLNFTPGLFHCRARIISTRDGKWRTDFATRLEPLAVREPGRQAWRVSANLADAVAQGLSTGRGDVLLADQRFDAPNGQETSVDVTEPKQYVRSITPAAGGNRADVDVIREGIEFRVRPLMADSTSIDLELDVTARKIVDQQAVVLDVPGEPNTVDVPEVWIATLAIRQRLTAAQHLLISLGRGPNMDPRPGLLRPRQPETLILLEIAPDPTNKIAGSPIPSPSPAAPGPIAGRTSTTRPKPQEISSKRQRESTNYSDLTRSPF